MSQSGNQSPYGGGANANLMGGPNTGGPPGLMGGTTVGGGGANPMMSPNPQGSPMMASPGGGAGGGAGGPPRGGPMRTNSLGMIPGGPRLNNPAQPPYYNMRAGSPQPHMNAVGMMRPMGGPGAGVRPPSGPMNRPPGYSMSPQASNTMNYNHQQQQQQQQQQMMRMQQQQQQQQANDSGSLMGGGGNPEFSGMTQTKFGPANNHPSGDVDMMDGSQGHPNDSGNYNPAMAVSGPASNNPQRATTPSIPSPAPGTPQNPPGAPQQQQQQQQQPTQPQQQQSAKEFNGATLCRIGQETVQEIVSRIQEVFSYLKSLTPPVGAADPDRVTIEKQQRLQEVLKGIALLFKRLHLCWGKANEYTIGMEYTSVESLIPLKGENNLASRDVKSELEKKRGEAYRLALEEHSELAHQLTLKNRHLKEIIDQMRNIIWEINTMLAMRQN